MPRETILETGRIEATILDFVRDELSGGEVVAVDADDNLLTSGLVDSVGIARLIAHMQDHLQIKVPPSEMVPANFRTTRIMAVYLRSLSEA